MPNVENLKQAVRVLEAVDEDRLHMNVLSERAECGTACCLVGWIALDPWFRENAPVGLIPIGPDGLPLRPGNIDIVGDALGLTRWRAYVLMANRGGILDDPHAITKAEVRENLERLIAGLEPREYAAIAAKLVDDY